MPRTRTKFIWPPPNLARDNSAEQQQQPQKKQKLESPSNTPSFAHATAIRHDNNNTTTNNNNSSPAPSDGQSQSSQVEWDPTSNVAPPSFEAVIRAYLQMPLEKVIQNYQNWRRHGSVHDDYCMMCHRPRPQDLVPCYTCRRSFHDDCMPPGSLYNDAKQWYCTVCVQRNWHVQPPTVTPPASPRLSAQNDNKNNNNNVLAAVDSKSSVQETMMTAEDSRALSILAEISRSMQTNNNNSNNNNNSGNARNPYISSTPKPKPSTQPGPQPQPQPQPHTQSFSMLDSHARKSRFATLSSEVDSALWVLYRELESATSLRQRIADLESEVVKLRQDVSIRDNQIILSQRLSSAQKSAAAAAAAAPVLSQAELEQLRAKAANWDACAPELEQLRAKNEALERSLRDARVECAAKDEALNEWKGRLASLIGS